MTKQDKTADPLDGLRLLSFKKVRELTTFSAQMLRIMAKDGRFPRPIQLGQKRIAFIERDVHDWLRQRAQAQRQTPAAWMADGEAQAEGAAV
jgi:prophage regulatory protein